MLGFGVALQDESCCCIEAIYSYEGSQSTKAWIVGKTMRKVRLV